MDYSKKGAMRAAIRQPNLDSIRTAMTRLCDADELERVPDQVRHRGDPVLYHLKPRPAPFLLGLVCRQRLDAGVGA